MSRYKFFVLCMLASLAFIVGYGTIAGAYPAAGVHGRGEFHGYRTNVVDRDGEAVLRQVYWGEAIRPSVNGNVEDFISFILNTKLDIDKNGSSGGQDERGATFIIQTMIGASIAERYNRPTPEQIEDWKDRVRLAADNGWITWRTNYSYTINSLYQGYNSGPNPDDDTFYDESGTKPAIVFRDDTGKVRYAIKWECANPVGVTSLPNEGLKKTNWSATGRSTVSNAKPLPGDTITFNHYVRNAGPTATSPTVINASVLDHPANTVIRGSHNTSTYTSGQEKLTDTVNYTVPIGTAPGTQICQKVQFAPGSSTSSASKTGTPVCATVQYDFDLTPIINISVNGSPPVGSFAEEGDPITFTYTINNGGTTVSQAAACNIYGRTVGGSYASPSPINDTSVGYTSPATGCPRAFPANSTTTLTSETIASAPANKTICRSLFVDPNAPGGTRKGTEVCIRVVSRPYMKVYGGDVSAGGGIATAPDTCTNNTNAAIVTWNKRSAGAYAGAGVQYAAFALAAITDFASAQSAGTSAAAPAGLSFANANTNVGVGWFGGTFGSAPCINDYYGAKPSSTLTVPAVASVTSMGSGNYFRAGSMVINGSVINPGDKISVYVDGDVFINGNITYPSANWSHKQIPSFRLIVRGNIYIASTVTQLDGAYIAQPNGAAGGTISTCATGSVLLPLGGSMYSTCNNKLTVNGAFVAKNIEFLRTRGTLARSAAGEANNSNNIAEVFNYTPVLWIPQQGGVPGGAGSYDAITSLPPIL